MFTFFDSYGIEIYIYIRNNKLTMAVAVAVAALLVLTLFSSTTIFLVLQNIFNDKL